MDRLTEFKLYENYPRAEHTTLDTCSRSLGQILNSSNSAADRSISLKFGRGFDYGATDILEMFKVKGQGHKVKGHGHSVT